VQGDGFEEEGVEFDSAGDVEGFDVEVVCE